MKKHKLIFLTIVIVGIMISCGEDYLTRYPSGEVVAGAPATLDIIEQNVTGAYQIMHFDCYANYLWMPVNMFFDVCSDDIYKGGGDAGDQEFVLLVSEFRSLPTFSATGWWDIFYAGLKRCNGALEAMNNAVEVQDEVLAKLRAEVLTLRAYYVHLLWKAYGNIPYFDKAWTEEPFLAKQYTFDEMYPIIIKDLDDAIKTPEFPMSAKDGNLGRITKAMAMMTKARVVMYYKDQSKYVEVLNDMKTIINNGAWALVTEAKKPNFTGLIKTNPDIEAESTNNPIEWMFLRDGEFCSESIFEVNSMPIGKDWGSPWQGFGNYTPRFTGPRDNAPAGFDPGWGFCPVQPSAYAIFEDADLRKSASVFEHSGGNGYQQTGLWLKKYVARTGYNKSTQGDPSLNYENNKRIYRLAETYLNAAELELAVGSAGEAQKYLDAIRSRAYGGANPPLTATLNNIKLERRREFFGEGLRFWDLVRWGSNENGIPISTALSVTDLTVPISRTWNDAKKFLPIPQGEIDKTKGTKFELKQNPGY